MRREIGGEIDGFGLWLERGVLWSRVERVSEPDLCLGGSSVDKDPRSRMYTDSLDQTSTDISPCTIGARPISPYTATAFVYHSDYGLQPPNDSTTQCSTGPLHLEVPLSLQVPSSRHTAH